MSSCASPEEDTNTIAIGLLLPFTGPESGTSANFERAAIYATDRVNTAGGVHGKRLRLVAADTHSNPSRSVESASQLMAERVVVVLGPESSDIAAAIEPIFVSNNVALLSPLVGAADDQLVRCDDRWFRLAPAARTLGESLAKQLSAREVPSIVILGERDTYNKAFANAVASRFQSLKGTVVLQVELDATAQTYGAVLNQVLQTGVLNIVLAMSPRTAALVTNEFYAALPTPPHWYLSPLLKTDLLVQNVAPAALNGAVGVAPKIYETTDTFPRAFQDRWDGELPLEGAYFYYDAMALVAYGLQAASIVDGGTGFASFGQAVLRIATTRGEPTGWNDIESGLHRLESGQQAYYAGVTGPMLLNTCGGRMIGTFTTWTVEGGQIVNEVGN